jgi:ATP-dependent DNA helicase RecQ
MDPPKPVDRDLLGRLKTARNLWATESQLPHYMVLANGVLEELARSCPKTLDGLLAIKGIGPAKVAKYGERLLEILGGSSSRVISPPPACDVGPSAASTGQRAASPSPSQRAPSSDGRTSTQSPPAHYWTWRLLERGFTQAECALIRGVDEQTVLDHAIAAGRDGRSVSLDAFLPADMIELLARTVAASEEMDSVLEDLPPEISEQHVQLYLLTKRTPSAP